MNNRGKPIYSEDQIPRLTPMEHVRLRPGMYIGGTDKRALHNLIHIAIDNVINAAFVGECNRLWISLRKGGEVIIKDNTPGIPIEMELFGLPFLEALMTSLGRHWRYGSPYQVGLDSLNLFTVNALSSEMKVEASSEGSLWQQIYKEGKRQTDVIQVRPLKPDETTGLKITFKPDFTVFEPNEFSYKVIAARCREVAYTVSNLTITLRDERRKKPKEEVFHYENGMADLVRDLNRKRTLLHPVIHSAREMTITPEGKNPYTVEVDVALQFTAASSYRERSYANTIQTVAGGTHIEGMRATIRDFINDYARKIKVLKQGEADLGKRQIQKGLTVALSIKHPHPTFESWSIIQLINPEMREVVADVVREALESFAQSHSDEMRRIVEQCLTYRK